MMSPITVPKLSVVQQLNRLDEGSKSKFGMQVENGTQPLEGPYPLFGIGKMGKKRLGSGIQKIDLGLPVAAC